MIDSILSIIYDGTMLEFPRPEDTLSYLAIGIFRINGVLLARQMEQIATALEQNESH